jgi:hypothetical protein
MEDSILKSTKKILGLDQNYTAFDLDILTHINTAFVVLHQLGIGPPEGFFVSDAETKWADYPIPDVQKNMVRSYVYLKARMLFDPPTTSFHIEAMKHQIEEFEFRLSVFREELAHPLVGEEFL